MAVALRNAAPLKPEIRLAKALSEYEAILTDEQKAKLRTYHGQRPPGATDVMRFTAEIDRETSHRKGRRCVGPRLTNVLQAVQQFSTIVDTIVGGSQSQIASAIWGVLKMSIQLASSFSSYFDNLSALFMNIGRTCPRYQDFGLLYPKSAGLQKALCEYFVAVVELCQQAVLFMRKPFFSQFSSSVLKPFQSEFGHFENDLGRLATTIREEASLASKQAQSDETKENSKFRALAVRFSDKVAQELQEARRLKSQKAKSQFLNAFSTYNHQTAWKQARKVGTTSWIYQKEEYKRWRQKPASSILWCTGILGSGKTVLSANVVENLMLTAPAAVISYFFCKHDDAESLKARTVIGSIARQLFSCVKLEVVDSVGPTNASFLDTDKVLGYLRTLLPSDLQEYFIIIDGLDECSKKELKLLIEYLKELLASTRIFHIYCSSRPDVYRWIPALLRPQWNVSMSEASSEITQYIESELEERLELGSLCLGDPTLILIIRDALVKGSQGMFLWVSFQLDSICSQETDESIVNTLQSLPKDLPETFDRILQKLEQSKAADPCLRKKIFQLVAAAQRPLTLEELSDAISVVPGETAWNVKKLVNDMHRALDYCGSLLVVDEEHLTVHFAHHSVKQHLLSNSTDPNVVQYRMCSSEADLSLGEICVTYLNFEVFNTQLTKTRITPQSQSINLPSVILSGTLPRSKVVGQLALRLLKARGDTNYDIHPQLMEATSLARESNKQIQQEYSFLSYAQEHWLFHSKRFEPSTQKSYRLWRRLVTGLVSTVKLPWAPEDLPDLGFDFLQWTVQNEHGALLYLTFNQLENGNSAKIETIWKMLLEKGLEFNVQGKYYGNALFMASGSGHEAIIRLLLEKGTEPNLKDNISGRTPLSLAAERGHEAAVRLLLEKGAKPNLKDNISGRTPLSLAAERGHEAAVRLLLEKGAEPNLKDNISGQTPLSWAAERGHEAVVRLLLERGAGLDSKDGRDGRTPLSRAAERGHEAVVRLLLERGAEPDSTGDMGGRTPLSWAAGRGREAVVRLLLERGAGLDSKDGRDGLTPLSWAAERGHEAVVRLLLERGAGLDSKDGIDDRTPLSRAAERGHEAMVRLLLEKGAEPDSTGDMGGRTPLSWAAAGGHEAVVLLLLERGAGLDSKGGMDGLTPLSWAADGGHEAVVRLLLERGAGLDSKDDVDGRTLLLWAVERDHEAVVRLLLEKGAEPNLKDGMDGRTPLSWAVRRGHEAVVRLLLERGAELDSKDGMDGRTPLSLAAEKGHEAAVRLLLGKGAEPNLKDGMDGRTPLSWAARRGHEAVVRLLLEKGAEPDSKDDIDGRTPLSWAAERGHEAVVRLLLGKGAKPDSKDNVYGLTPLMWAGNPGHKAVVRLLELAIESR